MIMVVSALVMIFADLMMMRVLLDVVIVVVGVLVSVAIVMLAAWRVHFALCPKIFAIHKSTYQ